MLNERKIEPIMAKFVWAVKKYLQITFAIIMVLFVMYFSHEAQHCAHDVSPSALRVFMGTDHNQLQREREEKWILAQVAVFMLQQALSDRKV